MIDYFRGIKQDYFKIYMFVYIFFLPYNFFSGFFSNLTIFLFIWWLIIGKKKGYFLKVKEIFTNLPLLILFLFILYACLSLLWSDNIKMGIKELEYYKYYPMIVMVFFTVFNKEDVKIAFYVITFSFALYALFSLSIYMEFFTVQLKDKISNKSNPRGILPYAVVTFYMAFNIFLSLYLFMKENNKAIKYLLLIIATMSFFTMLVNNGRMGQISFLGTFIIVIIYYRKYLLEYKKILISSVLVIALSISFMYSNNKIDRYLKGINELVYSYQNDEYIGSWGPRLFFYKGAIELIRDNLVFGKGIGDALIEFKNYQINNKEKLKHPIVKQFHSQHFELIVKFGIFGYVLFLMSIIILLIKLYKIEKDDYMYIGLIFFSMFLMASIGDGIMRMSNFDNFFILVFVLLSITIKENSKYKIGDKKII
ncbi:O-antigen ligase family protein [Aliarcobacter cryaerophilus]|jgi:O-antigen ligase|uniref:O-antigen ligase family protein n=1 Tax=Aliarcobacter cryaerophilus TaxID=28198 RepID=UPI003DA62A1C